MPTATEVTSNTQLRHSLLVRVTHWITVLAFIALLITGIEILISHPRFYWGEVGNVNTKPLFTFHIPSSRDTVPTGYGFVMPDQNGWSRYLHFEAAWLLVLTGIVYLAYLFFSGHLPPQPLPNTRAAFTPRLYRRASPISPPRHTPDAEPHTYNVLQRSSYLVVIFVLFPLIIWTGLAMSPSFTSAFPFTASVLGGRQSARTIHLFVTIALVLFLIVHVTMVAALRIPRAHARHDYRQSRAHHEGPP